VVALALAIAALCYVGNLSDTGRLAGFDGTIFDPGCDIGNPNCSRADLIQSCRNVGERDAEWRYCREVVR
jgi:hypothetical protein